jgi:hypothetical protein
MRLPSYKTNRLLWFVLSLLFFLFGFCGIDLVFDLFSGKFRIEELFSFEFIAPVLMSLVMGWLLQCVIIIIWSWKRKKSAPPEK